MFDEVNVFGSETAFDQQTGEPAEPMLPPAATGMDEGVGPDGMGAYAQPLPPMPDGGGDPPGVVHVDTMPEGDFMPMAMHGEWPAWESQEATPKAAARTAGFTALAATAAVGTGIAVGGGWGAGAGLLLAGALANGYRAQKWWGSPNPGEKQEAVVSAVFAVLGTGVGGYLAYKAWDARQED